MKTIKKDDFPAPEDIKKIILQGVSDGVFPCAAAGIIKGIGREKKKITAYYGNASIYPEKRKLYKNSYFDLASLTKPLATAMAVLCLIKNNKITLDEKIPSLLEKKIKDEKKNITVRQLLAHSSGFPAHKEYFKILKEVEGKKKKDFVERLLLEEKLEYTPDSKVLYSDLGFMLLGLIIEKRTGTNLDVFFQEKILKPLHLEKKIFFNPLYGSKNLSSGKEFVATENCPWRKKILCGEVHDDNCYAMGGVAGHSGLFGNIEGVTKYIGQILDMWKGVAVHPNINNRDLIKFLVRQNRRYGGGRFLGFDGIENEQSSSGKYFSKKSAGHLGFSGTSFWMDPEKHIVVVLLSNRVHPNRNNAKIKQYRPYFHNAVMEKISPT